MHPALRRPSALCSSALRATFRRCIVCGVGLGACGGPSSEPPPEAVFSLPADTVTMSWATIPVGAWLGGSRWVVVSGENNTAAVVAFEMGAPPVKLGGTGGEEIRNPYGTFTFGDTAHVNDWALRRLTRWTSDGRFAGALEAPADLRGALPIARDAAGQFYFEVRPHPRPDGSGLRDSAAIVRSSGTFARFDTVARLAPLDLAQVDDPTRGRRFERRVFSGTDKWGVFPDGTLWVARVYQNRVWWYTPSGQALRGQALPDRVIEVSDVDRDHFVLQFPEELRPTAERLAYSPLHPPFVSAVQDPGGDVWLEKSRPALDTLQQRYQVVDRAGRLRHLVILPGRTGRVIALGEGVALLAEQFREGIRLMQAPIPHPLPVQSGESP